MPSKKTSNERTEQIHLRVTPEEKKEIEDRAKKIRKNSSKVFSGIINNKTHRKSFKAVSTYFSNQTCRCKYQRDRNRCQHKQICERRNDCKS